ncbi:MAG: nitroreductase family protein [Defluviitaleaceae bacterium]|nr:nitroreductase family protein [Defluviitaleaceae bacterium]
MQNQVLDVIKARRSIRAYKSDALPKEQVETLVNAALHSPSAMNLRPWHIIAVTDRELINQMDKELVEELRAMGDPAIISRLDSRGNKSIYDAPALFLITTKKVKGFEDIDAGIMAQSICLAAKSMGLDSVMIAMLRALFASEKGQSYKSKLKFPPEHDFVIAVAVGHANQEAPPRELTFDDKVTYIG